MATSTAITPLRPENCTHKLPTSCRLTATPTCCACQDKRGHSSSYQKYIDGVGFVPWGTRQERYCWPCREFWNARVEISGLRQADTRIPERPDISAFLSKWYDWRRGYRVIRHDDGREERQALVGESLDDAAHGYLPRSVDELRGGLRPGEQELIERGGRMEVAPVQPAPVREEIELDPEDQHLFDTDDEDDAPAAGQEVAPADNDAGQTQPPAEHGHLAELVGDEPPATSTSSADTAAVRPARLRAEATLERQRESELSRPLRIAREHYQRVSSLRRELQRMRIGIERVTNDFQRLDIEVPDSQEALEQINRLSGRLSRYREAPLDVPEMNNPEWQSPITTMFERAWQRHNQYQSDRLHALTAQDSPPVRDEQGRLVPPVSRGDRHAPTVHRAHEIARERSERLYQQRVASNLESRTTLPTSSAVVSAGEGQGSPDGEATEEDEEEHDEKPFLGLDEPGRPAAIEDDEAFKIDNRCDVCLQQLATVATFPCGHMIMCVWCADSVVPRHPAARNVPRDPGAKCPQCRRRIRHIYTVRIRAVKEEAAGVHRENE